jgi:alpha-soluble NSF attachment protein
MESSGFS